MPAAVRLLRDLFRFSWFRYVVRLLVRINLRPALVTITGMSRRWVYYRLRGLASAGQATQTTRGQRRITLAGSNNEWPLQVGLYTRACWSVEPQGRHPMDTALLLRPKHVEQASIRFGILRYFKIGSLAHKSEPLNFLRG